VPNRKVVGRFTLRALTKVSGGALGLNVERIKNIAKRKRERSILDRRDDNTEPGDRNLCGGLDENRGDIGIYPSHP
jgi:hypothetical protein